MLGNVLAANRADLVGSEGREQVMVEHRLVAHESARAPIPRPPLLQEHRSDLCERAPLGLRDVDAAGLPSLLRSLESLRVSASLQMRDKGN